MVSSHRAARAGRPELLDALRQRLVEVALAVLVDVHAVDAAQLRVVGLLDAELAGQVALRR